jgi:DNA helicase-2/ATP-dependent DNA helicase PcrA
MGSKIAEEILKDLNPIQRKATTIGQGPAVVFAGAGSGKTRIITSRIAWLITEGVLPWEILAVTFTNKAASEMRERAIALNRDAERSLITTFHSACAKWLREFAPFLGFTSDFTIYDDSDSNAVIKKIMRTANFSIEKETTAAEFRAAINHAKTLGLFPADAQKHRVEFNTFMPTAGLDVYRAYQETLALSNAMDFGDLIMNMILLFRTNQHVKSVLQQRFKYILIDEYQDTNKPQMELIDHLSGLHSNLFVVGDDDQSIYSWRGAVPANILSFDKIYPNAVVCKLEENYRSTSNIVDAAAALVCHNRVRSEKTLKTHNPPGELIDFRYESDAEFEAWWVAKQISDEKLKFPYSSVAIFYRTNSQSRLLEDALRREGIPHQIYGSVRFYDRAEVKDILAYLRVLTNPRDDVSFLRAMNIPPRGLGEAAEIALTKKAQEQELTLWQAAVKICEEGTPRISAKMRGFIDTLKELDQMIRDLHPADLIESVTERIQYFSYLKKKYPDQSSDKEDNVMELASAIGDFCSKNPEASISDWLQMITLSSESQGDVKGVSLMTLHMAKGLEFERVYLTGLEEGLIPHFNSSDDRAGLEEERRLLYVGMTRAKSKLSLTASYMRRTWGNTVTNDVSRFLAEVPSKFIRVLSEGTASPSLEHDDEEGSQYYDYEDSSPHSETQIKKGSVVNHPTYGVGAVEDVQNNFGKIKLVVRFEDFGLRKIDPRHLEAP